MAVLNNLLSDFRFGARSLWKNRGVTMLAVLCLAVGVGLNATRFSVVHPRGSGARHLVDDGRREMAIRASLGAGKWRMVRQLLAESAMTGAIAAPLGLVFANIGTALLRAGMQMDDIPYYIQWRVDARTTLFTNAVAILTATVFGLMPALQVAALTFRHSGLSHG